MVEQYEQHWWCVEKGAVSVSSEAERRKELVIVSAVRFTVKILFSFVIALFFLSVSTAQNTKIISSALW